MSDPEDHIGNLFTAELQFRLASAVRLAVTGTRQPLDLPIEWTHGEHRVRYEEIALRQDQADYAASFLHRSATYPYGRCDEGCHPSCRGRSKSVIQP